MLAMAPPGSRVVAQRNAHASVVDGLVLSGGLPRFIAPAYDEGLGMAHGVTAEALGEALAAEPEARAAFVVSPTYYGLAADIAALAAIAHDAGVPLVVDQAWGRTSLPPRSAAQRLALGADAVLTSTHKIGGSLTQSAMLHLGPTGRIDERAISRTVRLVRSTSPSALLMGSLDAARASSPCTARR